MCLIIYTTETSNVTSFTEEHMTNSIRRNYDGCGAMYVEDGRVKVSKILGTQSGKTIAELSDWCFDIMNRDGKSVIHHRLSTHGSNGIENLHPYQVLSKDDGDPIDLYMMHNGIISKVKATGIIRDNDSKYVPSDTQLFVSTIVQPMLKKDHTLLQLDAVQKLFEEYIGSSKLIFLDSDNNITIVNEEQGTWIGAEGHQLWLSNTYSHIPSAATYSGYATGTYYKPEPFDITRTRYMQGKEMKHLVPTAYKTYDINDSSWYKWDPSTNTWYCSSQGMVAVSLRQSALPLASTNTSPPTLVKSFTKPKKPKLPSYQTVDELADILCVSHDAYDTINDIVVHDMDTAIELIEFLLEHYFQNTLSLPLASNA